MVGGYVRSKEPSGQTSNRLSKDVNRGSILRTGQCRFYADSSKCRYGRYCRFRHLEDDTDARDLTQKPNTPPLLPTAYPPGSPWRPAQPLVQPPPPPPPPTPTRHVPPPTRPPLLPSHPIPNFPHHPKSPYDSRPLPACPPPAPTHPPPPHTRLHEPDTRPPPHTDTFDRRRPLSPGDNPHSRPQPSQSVRYHPYSPAARPPPSKPYPVPPARSSVVTPQPPAPARPPPQPTAADLHKAALYEIINEAKAKAEAAALPPRSPSPAASRSWAPSFSTSSPSRRTSSAPLSFHFRGLGSIATAHEVPRDNGLCPLTGEPRELGPAGGDEARDERIRAWAITVAKEAEAERRSAGVAAAAMPTTGQHGLKVAGRQAIAKPAEASSGHVNPVAPAKMGAALEEGELEEGELCEAPAGISERVDVVAEKQTLTAEKNDASRRDEVKGDAKPTKVERNIGAVERKSAAILTEMKVDIGGTGVHVNALSAKKLVDPRLRRN